MINQKKFYLLDAKTKTTTPLAPREVECIIYILRGKTSKQIARMLELPHRTVEFYISRLKNKLFCHTKSELIEKVLLGRLVHQDSPESSQAQLIQEHHQIDDIIKRLNEERQEKKQKNIVGG